MTRWLRLLSTVCSATLSRVACYRWLPALAVGLSLEALTLVAIAQDRLDSRANVYDYTIGGVHYRVPGSYMGRSTHPHYVYTHLNFAFWVSDGKPIGLSVPPTGSKERHGLGWFWPPEPGRPFFSSQDFLVFVSQAVPLDKNRGLERQQWRRESVSGSPGPIAREDGLDCRTYPTGHKSCVGPVGEDPDVGLRLEMWPDNPAWDMTFYSRADSLWVQLNFPALGQSRWQDVVCRTLLLVRSWRVSAGPPLPDCSNSPRMSLLNPRESRP